MTRENGEGKFGSKTIGDGDFTTRRLQTDHRVNLPEGYAKYAGLDEDSEIAVVAKDGRLVLTDANMNDIANAQEEADGE